MELETVSFAEPLQNRQHTQTPNAVNCREAVRDIQIHREEGREGA